MSDEKVIRKSRVGRPAIGAGHQVRAVFRSSLHGRLRSWIDGQPGPKPSEQDAVRTLVERALDAGL